MFGTVCSGSHAGRMRAQEIGQNKAHMFAPRCAESAEIEKHAFLANLDNAGAHHVMWALTMPACAAATCG